SGGGLKMDPGKQMKTLVEKLRKLSAENPSPRDCIDEATMQNCDQRNLDHLLWTEMSRCF
ncbi:MAG: hypothetical protein M1449_02315, partial [Candidatus Thermoplasmatota archaeon]|nr:hypothetical protein [Candidatus Thermoplasmatota archaeon]